MADYAKELLDAIELLAEHKIINAGFDKTIKATVQSSADAARGIYSCKYEATTFTAIGDKSAYQSGDIVMVNIPQNNWDNVKTILNKVYTEVIDTKTLDPFANFLDVNNGEPLIFSYGEEDSDEFGAVKANILSQTTRPLNLQVDNFQELYSEPYSRMGIEVAMKTAQLGTLYNVNGGTYGVVIKFYKNDSLLAQYGINNDKMFGNLYNFGDYTTQRAMVTIDPEIMLQATSVRAQVYQNNDFTQQNENGGTERLVYPIPEADVDFNIFAKDLKLYFGYGKEEYKEGDLILSANAGVDPQYYFKWEDARNTKSFSLVYWSKDAEGNLVRSFFPKVPTTTIFLEKRAGSGDWNLLEYSYESSDYLLSTEDMANNSVSFRAKIEVENYDGDTITMYRYSNEVVFYRWKATVTSLERDLESALSLEYNYEGNEYGVEYNDIENHLLTQREHLCPHSFFVRWNPITEELKDPTYLRGAVVTYKVPAFKEIDYGKSIAEATERFRFETTTVIQHPEPDWEYGGLNQSIRYENIEGISYICWDVILGDGFVYSPQVDEHYHWWGEVTQLHCGMQGLTLDLRPKEFYLPSMINNKIYCVIKQGDYTFETSIDFPIQEVNTSETLNRTFILTEDMKKAYLTRYERGGGYLPPYTFGRLYHFCTYRQNYNGEQEFKNNIHIMRSVLNENNVIKNILQEGYYQEENGVLHKDEYDITTAEKDKISWYTLDTRNLLPSDKNLEFLMLQVLTGGITTIIEIPTYFQTKVYDDSDFAGIEEYSEDHSYEINNLCKFEGRCYKAIQPSEYIIFTEANWTPYYPNSLTPSNYFQVLEGINKIYFNANGNSLEDQKYGPSDNCFGQDNIFLPLKYVSINEIYRNQPYSFQHDLTSYETDKDNIFYPTTELENVSNYYYPNTNTYMTADAMRQGDVRYYNGEGYLKGKMEEDENQHQDFVWYNYYKEEEYRILQSEFPYTCPNNGKFFGLTEVRNLFLRFNQPGFTQNYKNVGSGNDYPAESLVVEYMALPIVFQQRQLYRDDFVQWDGTKVQIGEDAIYSPVIGAGRKNEGKFSGCLMGDISTIDFSQDSSMTNLYGLYGYKDDEQSFGLRADGTMFLGKNGRGRLIMDGNTSTIQSANYKDTEEGMQLDLDDAIINMQNIEGYTEADKNRDLQAAENEKIAAKDVLIGSLQNLYNNSSVWNYTLTEDTEYIEGHTYYYVPDGYESEEGVYFYTLDEVAQPNKTYYTRLINEYIIADWEVGTSVWFITEDQIPGDKTYFILELGEYVPQEPITEFTPGVDYYERNYYYEKDTVSNYSNIMELVLFEGTAQNQADMKTAGTLFYHRTAPSERPYGYNLRVYWGEAEMDPGILNSQYYTYLIGDGNMGDDPSFEMVQTTDRTPDSRKIYYTQDGGVYQAEPRYIKKFASGKTYYEKVSVEGKVSYKTYFEGQWITISTSQVDTQVVNHELLNYRESDLNDLRNVITARNAETTYANAYNKSSKVANDAFSQYNNRKNAYKEAISEYNSVFYGKYNYPIAFSKAETAKQAADDDYLIAKQNFEANPTLENWAIYNEADLAKRAADAVQEDALNMRDNHETLFENAKFNVNDTNRFRQTALLFYLDSLNHTAQSVDETEGLRHTFVNYYAYHLATVEFQTYVDSYSNAFVDYDQCLQNYAKIYEINTKVGKRYIINLDASDNNLSSLGNYPLRIGEVDSNETTPFMVNWKGAMTATEGDIGGWTIDKEQLKSENDNCILTSKKSKSSYPIQIGNNFKVDWNGNIYAETIHLGKKGGVLDGDENGKTVIKNINMVNNNGKGLNFDSEGNLLLDVGLKIGGNKIILDGNAGEIKLMSGGKITCGDSSVTPYGSTFLFDGNIELHSSDIIVVGGKVSTPELFVANATINQITAQGGVTHTPRWQTLTFTDGEGQSRTIQYLGYDN